MSPSLCARCHSALPAGARHPDASACLEAVMAQRDGLLSCERCGARTGCLKCELKKAAATEGRKRLDQALPGATNLVDGLVDFLRSTRGEDDEERPTRRIRKGRGTSSDFIP